MIFYQQTAMDWCSIPKEQDFAWNMPLQMAQEGNDLGTFDAARMNLKIKPPQGQPADDGKALPVEGLLQHRRLSAWSPCAHARRARAQSAFIDEDDGSTLLEGLFFKAGHSVRFQRRMAFSSRSTARRSGRWQLKPLAPIIRQT